MLKLKQLYRVNCFTAIMLAVGLLSLSVQRAFGASREVVVTVESSHQLGFVPPDAFGMNTEYWDELMNTTQIPKLLRSAGITTLRWPGGSHADIYHWTPPQVDSFVATAKRAKSNVIFTVDYGSGTPSEAAAWVRYANVVKHYGIKYWEIGNEIYGAGEYGKPWEADLHADHSPSTYAINTLAFMAAMKAQDPTIQCGVDLIAPGVWPDGVLPDWNQTVLSACGSKIDFVIIHWYPEHPGSESDAFLLKSTAEIAAIAAKTRALVDTYCGARAAHIPIFLTETNSVSGKPGKQSVSLVNALFVADTYMTWLENGAANIDLWALHYGPKTGNNDNPTLYGNANYGDWGILSNGVLPEPPAETPFPTFYAMQILKRFARQGDTMLAAASASPLLAVHAVRNQKGNLSLLLINKDPVYAQHAHIILNGFAPNSHAVIWQYGETTPSVEQSSVTAAAGQFIVAVPPYSMAVLVFRK